MSETEPITVPYVALTGQPAGTPWPTDGWPTGDAPSGVPLGPLLDELFDDTGPLATTYAAVVIHRGRLVAERYAGELERWDGPSEQSGPDTRFLSWSIAKSMLHAVVGMLVGEGRLDLDAPAPVPAWQGPGDPRRAITLQDMLEMRDGLDFVEQYVIGSPSDVIDMLFGSGQQDMAAFTEAKPLAVPPGSRFNYASGTSNVISAIVARLIGRGEVYGSFLHRRLFDPIGMTSALPGFDEQAEGVHGPALLADGRHENDVPDAGRCSQPVGRDTDFLRGHLHDCHRTSRSAPAPAAAASLAQSTRRVPPFGSRSWVCVSLIARGWGCQKPAGETLFEQTVQRELPAKIRGGDRAPNVRQAVRGGDLKAERRP